jgi:hypothetical protein
MKIIYYTNNSFHNSRGVLNKISIQIRSWRKLGCHVTFVYRDPKDKEILLHAPDFADELYYHEYPGCFVEKIRNRMMLGSDIDEFLSQRNFDIIYSRSLLLDAPTTSFIKRINSIFEVNTDMHQQRRYGRSLLVKIFLRIYNEIFIRLIIRRAPNFIAVTKEIANQIRKYNRNSLLITIPNSYGELASIGPVNPNFVKPHELKQQQKRRKRLFFIGSDNQPWHGVDKIIKMAQILEELVEIDIVGPDQHRFDVPSNVRMHGYLNRDEYQVILSNSDICIGSLAFHRVNLQEGCPLKVREYIANRKPVIIAYDDTSLSEYRGQFILRLPNSEDNIFTHRSEIISFIQNERTQEYDQELINLISPEYWELERVKFFRRIHDMAKQQDG